MSAARPGGHAARRGRPAGPLLPVLPARLALPNLPRAVCKGRPSPLGARPRPPNRAGGETSVRRVPGTRPVPGLGAGQGRAGRDLGRHHPRRAQGDPPPVPRDQRSGRVSAPANATHPAGDTVAETLAARYPHLTPGQYGLLEAVLLSGLASAAGLDCAPCGHPDATGRRPRHQHPHHRQLGGAVPCARSGPGGFPPP